MTIAEIIKLVAELGFAGLFFVMWFFERRDRISTENKTENEILEEQKKRQQCEDDRKQVVEALERANRAFDTLVNVVHANTEAQTRLATLYQTQQNKENSS